MQNLKAIWEGCASLSHLWGSSLKPHALFMKDFLQPNAVTFVSRTLSTRSQSSMWDQLRTVPWIASTVAPAELALRFWRDHQNLLIWAPIPLFVRLADYRCLEPALIQEWLTSTELPFHLPIFQPFPIQIVTMANYPCVGFLEQAVIAEGFLSNKVFPTKKEYTAVMIRALHQWTKQNGLPSIPNKTFWPSPQKRGRNIASPSRPTLPNPQFLLLAHLSKVRCFIVKTNKHRLYDFLPVPLLQVPGEHLLDNMVFESLNTPPTALVNQMVSSLERTYGKSYPWALGTGRQLSSGYILAKKKKQHSWTSNQFVR